MKQALFSRHGIIAMHLAIGLLLMIGLVERTGAAYIPQVVVYFGVLVAAYVAMDRIVPWRLNAATKHAPVRLFIQGVLIAQVLLMAAHWASAGGVPLWQALHEADDLKILEIRRSAGENLPLVLDYASHLMLKALVPVALLLAWTRNRKLFWWLAATAAIYAMSLLAKSFVITLFVPLWIAFLLARQWVRFTGLTAIFLLLTIFLSTAANPQKLRTEPAGVEAQAVVPEDRGVQEHGFVLDALLGVAQRVLLTPGWTVAAWFTHIPADLPYAHGSAVRPMAVVLGLPYVDYSEAVYKLAYPEMAAKHVPGTMGSAAFMYGYANFGTWGLFAAGLVTAVLLLAVQRVYGDQWKWSVVLNAFPLLSLSGSALPTVLLTHGWGLTILLFLWLRPAHEPAA